MFEKSFPQSARPTLWEILQKVFFKHALVPVIQPTGGIICKSFNIHIRLTTLDTLLQKHQWNQGDNKKTTFPVPLA